jgi:phage portal protein BeeE
MSRPSGVLSTEQILTGPQVEELRKRWNDQSAGLNAGGVPILTAGLKWQAVSLNANDSQLIEALKMNDRTIAGVFGVPGILIGLTEDAAWASTEALMNFWLANGRGVLLDHIEVAIDQFFGLPANEYTEYDTDALLRTAYKDRVEALKSGVTGGIYSPNEARAREGLPEVDGGEEPRVQQQQVPLSFASLGSIPPVGGQPTTPSETPPAPAVAAPTDASPDGENAPDAADPAKDIPDVDFEVLGAQVRLLIEHHHDP